MKPLNHPRFLLIALCSFGLLAGGVLGFQQGSPGVAPFSRSLTTYLYTHAVKNVVGLADLQTVLFQWAPFDPQPSRLSAVESYGFPFTAEVQVNGQTFTGAADAYGVVSVLVPLSAFDLNGGENVLSYVSYDAQGDVLTEQHGTLTF